MDVAVEHDRQPMLAPAMREFAASRIEKQLLIQVFELLCKPATNVEYPEPMCRDAASARSAAQISTEQSPQEKPRARRRAA